MGTLVTEPTVRLDYGSAIRSGFQYLLSSHPEVFVMGQGLWSPWYVGNTMTELEIEFGRDRVIDTPVSEQASTGAAIGAAIAGRRVVVVHPRMDFMILAMDQIVGQAAKWSSMFAGQLRVPVVVRAIINRGGEQGAQHSQALHSWFAHVPGLRVVMPVTVADARDMLIAATLSDDPTLYIDDRWLYERTEDIPAEPDLQALERGCQILIEGRDLTVVAAGYSVQLAETACAHESMAGVGAELIDLRVLNPLDIDPVVRSVTRTGRLLVVDGGWTSCGLAGEIIAAVAERVPPEVFACSPRRITLQDAPAPTSAPLERRYYPDVETVVTAMLSMTAAP